MNTLLGWIKARWVSRFTPLTDASIGAYTAGVAMLILGALGVEERQMAHGALLAISFGLIVAPAAALTGLIDWLDIPKGTPARTADLALAPRRPAAAAHKDPRGGRIDVPLRDV